MLFNERIKMNFKFTVLKFFHSQVEFLINDKFLLFNEIIEIIEMNFKFSHIKNVPLASRISLKVSFSYSNISAISWQINKSNMT